MRDYTKIKAQHPELLYFTSDLHFFHEGIIGHCARPYNNAQEMGAALIRNWNAVVHENGQVFVLGDMFWKRGDLQQCKNVMAKLHGKKWLVAGNHDIFARDEYLELGFEDARDYLELAVGWQLVVCCHYPLLEWNGFYHGSWHLHGHAHGRGSHFSFRVKDVGTDANNYLPVSWAQIERELRDGRKADEETMKERGDIHRHRPYSF